MDTIGTLFQVSTFGESHGLAIGGVIAGCPAGLAIDTALVQKDLQRRQQGDPPSDSLVTRRREPDAVTWLSGMLPADEGTALPLTTGAPLAFIIENEDARSQDYEVLRQQLRPGHGDYTWLAKYGLRDYRGGGRCSARVTAAWVVAGAVAKQLLALQGVSVSAAIAAMGTVEDSRDTAGGSVSCTATGVPAGWGEPMFGSLKARLALAMMCIPSAVSFEMGIGKAATAMLGSEYTDQWKTAAPDERHDRRLTTQTNRCGGVQGGISNGMPVQCMVGFHPIVTLQQPVVCADAETGELSEIMTGGRHDLCQVPRAVPIVEAMAAITLADCMLLSASSSCTDIKKKERKSEQI